MDFDAQVPQSGIFRQKVLDVGGQKDYILYSM
jgi:hypothetical protein